MRVFLVVVKLSFPTPSEISRNVAHFPTPSYEPVTVPPGSSERARNASVEALHKALTWPSQNASTEGCKWIAPRIRFSHVAYMSHPKETAKLIEEAATSGHVK